jgi:hypothetical protein
MRFFIQRLMFFFVGMGWYGLIDNLIWHPTTLGQIFLLATVCQLGAHIGGTIIFQPQRRIES